MNLTKFERAVRTSMQDGALVGYPNVTDECARLYAKELLKEAIRQLREDGNIVEIRNPID